jgi:hypothetical protein
MTYLTLNKTRLISLKSPFLAAGFSACLLFFGVASAEAETLTVSNPSFESPAIPANTEQAGTPTDWTLSSGQSYIDNGTAVSSPNYGDFGGPAPDGQQVADIGGADLFQNTGVALVTGTTYTLSFYAATSLAEEFFGALSAAGDTTSEGTDFGYLSFTVSQHSAFSLYSVSATYTGASGQFLTVVLGDNSPSYGYAGFDAVTLSSISAPEPGTVRLLGIAMVAGILLHGFRRRII